MQRGERRKERKKGEKKGREVMKERALSNHPFLTETKTTTAMRAARACFALHTPLPDNNEPQGWYGGWAQKGGERRTKYSRGMVQKSQVNCNSEK